MGDLQEQIPCVKIPTGCGMDKPLLNKRKKPSFIQFGRFCTAYSGTSIISTN
jgi:hypothetical protein